MEETGSAQTSPGERESADIPRGALRCIVFAQIIIARIGSVRAPIDDSAHARHHAPATHTHTHTPSALLGRVRRVCGGNQH